MGTWGFEGRTKAVEQVLVDAALELALPLSRRRALELVAAGHALGIAHGAPARSRLAVRAHASPESWREVDGEREGTWLLPSGTVHLLGVEDQAVEAQRCLSGLPPGRYRVRVVAADDDECERMVEAELEHRYGWRLRLEDNVGPLVSCLGMTAVLVVPVVAVVACLLWGFRWTVVGAAAAFAALPVVLTYLAWSWPGPLRGISPLRQELERQLRKPDAVLHLLFDGPSSSGEPAEGLWFGPGAGPPPASG